MKVTIEISDDLHRALQALAQREGTTISALVEEALAGVVHRVDSDGPFRLRDASVEGKGLRPGIREGDFRELAQRWD